MLNFKQRDVKTLLELPILMNTNKRYRNQFRNQFPVLFEHNGKMTATNTSGQVQLCIKSSLKEERFSSRSQHLNKSPPSRSQSRRNQGVMIKLSEAIPSTSAPEGIRDWANIDFRSV